MHPFYFQSRGNVPINSNEGLDSSTYPGQPLETPAHLNFLNCLHQRQFPWADKQLFLISKISGPDFFLDGCSGKVEGANGGTQFSVNY